MEPETVRNWVACAAARHPDKPYLISVEDGRAISYRELGLLIERIRAFFAEEGIGPGDRVALLANNSLEHVVVYLGTLAAGATICTVHVEMNAVHFDTILPALAPRLVIYEEGLGLETAANATDARVMRLGRWEREGGQGFFAALPQAPNAPDPSGSPTDDAVIYFTSGTGSRPKGVVLTYREILSNGAAIADGFGIRADDRVYDYRSFNWASAQLLGALATLSKGATLLLRRRFSRRRFFDDIARHGATVAAGNPTVIAMLLAGEEAARPTGLRFVTSSSAPLSADDWRRFEERFGVRVAQGYGTSETGWIAACPETERRIGTAGKPLPYLELAIVDRDGRALPPEEIGRVEVGGFAGNEYRYLGDDGTPRVNAIGRVRTGDMGFLDTDGYLHITGRESDLIIRGGVNISPLEIDNALTGLAGIVEAATVGVPDPVYGEEVVSHVVLAPGASLSPHDILDWCAARIPAFKAPKRIYVRSSLPKTERGKLDRKALARDLQEG